MTNKERTMIFSGITLVLTTMLDKEGVPYNLRKLYDGYQLTFPWTGGDVVCHGGSYGSCLGHFESMGFPWDEDGVTELTLDEAFNGILRCYKGEEE